MQLATVGQQVLNALELGAIYALIALGFNLIFGVAGLLNFAHGQVFMVGAFAAYVVAVNLAGVAQLSDPLLLLIVAAASMATGALLGLLLSRGIFVPLLRAEKTTALIASLGVGLLLQNGMSAAFGAVTVRYPDRLYRVTPVSVGPLTTSNAALGILIVSIAVLVLLRLFVQRTQQGRFLRAVELNPTAASLMGIDVPRVIDLTIMIGSALAALAGLFYGIMFPVLTPDMGVFVGWKAFFAVVLGGLGSMEGAYIGGFLLGIVEIFVPYLFTSSYTDVVVYGILIAVLMLRPGGILGMRAAGSRV
ncbi:MAG: branched-chain amino acid ABC transporter permease [Candidatus Limnocylindrales bacterium]